MSKKMNKKTLTQKEKLECPMCGHTELVDNQNHARILALETELEAAREALKFECGNRCAIGINPCNARDAFERIDNFLKGGKE